MLRDVRGVGLTFEEPEGVGEPVDVALTSAALSRSSELHLDNDEEEVAARGVAVWLKVGCIGSLGVVLFVEELEGGRFSDEEEEALDSCGRLALSSRLAPLSCWPGRGGDGPIWPYQWSLALALPASPSAYCLTLSVVIAVYATRSACVCVC